MLSLPGLSPAAPPAPVISAAEGRRLIGRYRPGDLDWTTVTAEVHKRDVTFKVHAGRPRPPQKLAKRGAVKGFSPASAKRLRMLVRNTADQWKGFVTLTYPSVYPGDGATCKAHMNAFCHWLRRRGVAYLWVLEFQERGAPHFHVLVSDWIDKEALSLSWWKIVGSRDAAHLKYGTRIDGIKNPDEVGVYMAKYISKLKDDTGFETKRVPASFDNVGRFWGASRNLDSVLLYQLTTVYGDAVEELEPQVNGYREARLGWAERMQAEAERQPDPARRAKLEARSMSYGKPWDWKGYGFTFIGGAPDFRALMREAVEMDRRGQVWREWDGEEKAPPHPGAPPSPELAGQLLLDGRHECDLLPSAGL